MIQYSSDITFQNAITSPNVGSEHSSVAGYETATIEIVGTSTSRTVKFQGKGVSGAWYDIKGINMTTGITSTSTTGEDEIWQIPICGLKAFRCNVTAVAGGNVSIYGTLQG